MEKEAGEEGGVYAGCWGWAKEGARTEERIGRPGLLLCLIPP